MNAVAWKMLTGDRAKFFGLVFTVAFSAMLMQHQAAIFTSLMRRTAAQIRQASDASVWVMDPRTQYWDENEPLPATALGRVRGVEGVRWAVPLFKNVAKAKTREGGFQVVFLEGHDDASLVGVPRQMLLGSPEDLRRPDAVLVDDVGYGFLWPGEPFALGKTLEMNDRRAVVAGIFRTDPPFQTLPLVHTLYSRAVRYTGSERNVLSFVLAQPAEGVTPEEASRRIREATGLQARTTDEFSWMTIRYYLTHTGIPVNFGITIAVALLVGVVVAGQTFYIFTIENLKQFGALKAIGITNARLTGMILLQALAVGGMGFAFGTGMAASFFEATKDISHLRGFFLPWPVTAAVAVAVLGIVCAASLLSIRKVWRLEPAVVFRG